MGAPGSQKRTWAENDGGYAPHDRICLADKWGFGEQRHSTSLALAPEARLHTAQRPASEKLLPRATPTPGIGDPRDHPPAIAVNDIE
jgi:hypothetical protein